MKKSTSQQILKYVVGWWSCVERLTIAGAVAAVIGLGVTAAPVAGACAPRHALRQRAGVAGVVVGRGGGGGAVRPLAAAAGGRGRARWPVLHHRRLGAFHVPPANGTVRRPSPKKSEQSTHQHHLLLQWYRAGQGKPAAGPAQPSPVKPSPTQQWRAKPAALTRCAPAPSGRACLWRGCCGGR